MEQNYPKWSKNGNPSHTAYCVHSENVLISRVTILRVRNNLDCWEGQLIFSKRDNLDSNLVI